MAEKATTSRAQSAFRNTFHGNLPRISKRRGDGRMYLPEEEFIYGRPNRPSTPVGDVVSNYYGEKATNEISQKYEILRETTKPLGLSFARSHTKASALAHSHISQTKQSLMYEAEK